MLLGSVGSIMSGTGLEELLENVYARVSVPQMLNGHAYSRTSTLSDTSCSCYNHVQATEMCIVDRHEQLVYVVWKNCQKKKKIL